MAIKDMNKNKKGYKGINHTRSKNGKVGSNANTPIKKDTAYPTNTMKGKSC